MKKTKNKLISLVLTLVMVVGMIPLTVAPAVATSFPDWIKLDGSTGGQTIGTNGQTEYYYIDANTTCSNSNAGGSGLTIEDGATVYIYIPTGVTLTVQGGNGADAGNGGATTQGNFTFGNYNTNSGKTVYNFPTGANVGTSGKGGDGATGGGAGIYVPQSAKLIVYGSGTLNATGGNGGKAGNGAEGKGSLYWYISIYKSAFSGSGYIHKCNQSGYPTPSFSATNGASLWGRGLTGAGGAGGGGAAGGGAAIGTPGASGYSGVAGANGQLSGIETSIGSNRAQASENNTKSTSASAAGIVYIASDIQTNLSGGQGGNAGTRPDFAAVTKYSYDVYNSNGYVYQQQNFALSQGQSGGAGAGGGNGASIGAGGGGGAGGAGGDAGAFYYGGHSPETSNQGANGKANGAVGTENANTALTESDIIHCKIVLATDDNRTYSVGAFGSFTVPAVDANGAAVLGWKVKTQASLLPTASGSSATSDLAVFGKLLEANSTISTAEIIGDVELMPLNVTDWHLEKNICDSNDGKGGLMGHQYNKENGTIGRTIIGLTQEQLNSIGDKLVIVGGDSGKQTTFDVDCAYTYFYDDNKMITAESMKCAAFVIIEDDKDGKPISGYGYYRLYSDSADSEDNFLFDVMYKDPSKN